MHILDVIVVFGVIGAILVHSSKSTKRRVKKDKKNQKMKIDKQIQEKPTKQPKREVARVKSSKNELIKVNEQEKNLIRRRDELLTIKTNYLKEIDNYNLRFINKVGYLIQEIFNTKIDRFSKQLNLYDETRSTIDTLEDLIKELEVVISQIDVNDEEYISVDLQYNELLQQLNQLQESLKLYNKDELVKQYNIVDDEYKTYLKIKETLLKNSDALLKNSDKSLSTQIKLLTQEIRNIENDETYKIVKNIEDVDEYFEKLEADLKDELDILKLRKDTQDIFPKKLDIPTVEQDTQEVSYKKPSKQISPIKRLEKEQSLYATVLEDMIVPTFAKLIKTAKNNDDALSGFLSKNGKIYKSLFYSAYESLFESVDSDVVDIVDWDCTQGLASSLLLDYIREKQLNIKVKNISLVENDTKQLQRALLHIETLKEYDIDISTDDIVVKNPTIHLFSDLYHEKEFDKDKIVFSVKDNYMVFLSVDDDIDTTYDTFDGEILSDKDGKVGRFKRYEKILKIQG